MIFLPAHLCPSKTGQTICGILLFLGLVLYRLILLCLRDVIPKNCIGSTIFCIALAAFCCIWPSWRSTRTVMWTGRWKRRLFLKENHMCVSPHTFFLQVLPIKSSAALWPVVILKYFVLVERPLSTKNPLELNNMKSWLVWKENTKNLNNSWCWWLWQSNWHFRLLVRGETSVKEVAS